ncbi:MAG: DNA double-strand break repair nuclease NurA [archaeon]|nr:DNA double-strand break repair nuclease NurA [archaeon]
MLDSLYTEAIQKKEKLIEQVDVLSKIKSIDVEKYWFEEPITKSGNAVKIAAGDGSYNSKKYLSFNFYAVSAVSLIYTDKLDKIESIELDTLSHQSFLEDRLRNIMGLFEIKNAIKSIEDFDIDYYLDDGSLLGDLIRPFPIEKEISSKKKEEIVNFFKEKLQNEIRNADLGISSSKFKKEFKDLFSDENSSTDNGIVSLDKKSSTDNSKISNIDENSDNNSKEIDEDNLIAFLENIEKLLALSYLLKNKKKIIAISKTSSSNDLLHANISDMAIFDAFSKKQGFSKPYYKYMSSEMKREFPVENEFFRDLVFTVFFARLDNNKNIIKIELPYKADTDEIRKILSDIKRDSVEGYPYLLKKAHNEVVIKRKNIEELSKIVGFIEKSGREMLN